MRSPVWRQALEACADPQRATHLLQKLDGTAVGGRLVKVSPEQARVLAAVIGGSQALGESLVAHPEWVERLLDTDDLQRPRRRQGLQRELGQIVKQGEQDSESNAAALNEVRLFFKREMLCTGARDLSRLAGASDVMREISKIADVCLSAVYALCWADQVRRLGQPYWQDPDGGWMPGYLSVLGLGKLGGQELNYSSDVDLMFVYTDEGNVFREPPKRKAAGVPGMSNFRFFQKLIEAYVNELTCLTAQGGLFRVDLRLRPEGPAGPVARSLESYENYYAQYGQTWERMMLIKARCVAGDTGLAGEFLEMVQPFRYPRSIGDRIVREVAATKRRIETEVVRAGEIERNVKLGRGGIREIEFLVQTLQMLHAGKNPFLQHSQTLPALEKLVQYKFLTEEQGSDLTQAYCFLRDVEHRLQMENNLQTHTIPAEEDAKLRLARSMGFDSVDGFETELESHAVRVRSAYEAVIHLEEPEEQALIPNEFDGNEAAFEKLLAQRGFHRLDDSLPLIKRFMHGPGYVHVSPRTVDLARQLLSRFMQFCPRENAKGESQLPQNALSDPDRVLARIDSYVEVYGARSTLYETWVGNPSLFELLLLLFDRSEYLAEIAIRTPDLTEEIVRTGQLHRRKRVKEILKELRAGSGDADQLLWLRRYHQAELMRLGLRDILGLAGYEQNLFELSGLADATLEYALEIVLRRFRFKKPPFAIIGLGKLGGNELAYGSDLDILFVASPRVRHLEKLQKAAGELIELVGASTELGIAFVVDTRLRPYGEDGLLVNNLDGYRGYYEKKAQLWEIQALSRHRFIAGDSKTGEAFQELAVGLADFRVPRPELAGWSEGWRNAVDHMRHRIESERTPHGKERLAIKTGAGGIIDVEFIAQTICLAHGWTEPNTLAALARAQVENVLVTSEAEQLILHYRKLRRLEGILRRWSFVGETQIPDSADAQLRVAIRCGFPKAELLLSAIDESRRTIRKIYLRIFPETSFGSQ